MKKTVNLPCDKIVYRKLQGSDVRWVEKYIYHNGKYADLWLGSILLREDGYYHANYNNEVDVRFKTEKNAVAFVLYRHGLTEKESARYATKLVNR